MSLQMDIERCAKTKIPAKCFFGTLRKLKKKLRKKKE